MDSQSFINGFISSYEIEENRFSCLMIALDDARKITGRNIQSGIKGMNILKGKGTFLNPHSFIGIINYLLILDMTGKVFKTTRIITDFNHNKDNNIYKALKQFSFNLNDKDIDTIIALRNCLAHNYGLINISSHKEIATKQHKFILTHKETVKLIEYPLGVWMGDFSDKSGSSGTKISHEKLIDLVESVYENIRNEFDNGSLLLNLDGGVEELKARFTIRN